MDDMKDKVKGFMKKVNNPFTSSSSGKFKGQGRVLGGSSSSTGPPSSNQNLPRPSHIIQSKPNPPPVPSKPLPEKTSTSDQNSSNFRNNANADRKLTNGFDPYDSLVTTGKRSQNGYSLNVFECPVCNQSFRSEEEVSIHVDSCVNSSNPSNDVNVVSEFPGDDSESGSELETCVGAFLSGKPSEGSVEVVIKLFRNIVREPENAKFRKIRMSNPKIREAVGEVGGGVELLECVGFELQEDGGEIWAVMEVPTEVQISVINKAVSLLEPQKSEVPTENLHSAASVGIPNTAASVGIPNTNETVKPKKVERQIRVFFSVPENVASKIEVPDSFYKLSLEEVKREADMRKKKLADSQLLIPKSYKEKQAKAARRRYSRTVIRIQFPDGVVLQGVFAPWEPTSSLYEFVSSALKEPCLEFELMHPVLVKRRVIPHFPAAGEKAPTLDEEDLVPSALVKFKPVETDSVVFTGLSNELLQISEPLVSASSVPPL